MTPPPGQYPLTSGFWKCGECGTDGIGGGIAFHFHYLQAHYDTPPTHSKGRP